MTWEQELHLGSGVLQALILPVLACCIRVQALHLDLLGDSFLSAAA